VFGDFNYAVEAERWEGEGKSKRISITEKSTDLQLVLKRE